MTIRRRKLMATAAATLLAPTLLPRRALAQPATPPAAASPVGARLC